MTVPDFQAWFLPLLLHVADGDVHKLADIYPALAAKAKLSPEDLGEKLPSGKQLKYRNRIGWARTYLIKAGLLSTPQRAHVQITPAGKEVLSSRPERLDVKFLKQFEPFRTFYGKKGGATHAKTESTPSYQEVGAATPEESLEAAHGELREALKEELLEKVREGSPEFFETLVVDLLVKIGYGGSLKDAGQTLGRSGDGGVDGVIKEDLLGLDAIYIQAKRWADTVGRPIVQAFAGSLEGVRARKGVLITTSSFSSGAEEYVSRIEKKIVLIDGAHLVDLMFDHGLGVSLVSTYEVKRIDLDFFEEA
jgi:restriction system protein